MLNDVCQHCNLDSDFENIIDTQILQCTEIDGEIIYTILSGEKLAIDNILEVLE